MKIKSQQKTGQVNFQTEWRHHYLKPNQYFYFPSNTPIKEIVPKLQNGLNTLYPDLKVDYESSGIISGFHRLYRNLTSHYKGWQVSYRKPDSREEYHGITEKIGYKSRKKKQSLQNTVLKNTMLWTHELDLLIDPVEMKGVTSCSVIAKRLNEKINRPNYNNFFNQFNKDLDVLARVSNQNWLSVDCKTDKLYQRFCETFKNIYDSYQQINVFMSKNWSVQRFNITDVLKNPTKIQHTKGWRVDLSNENQP